MVPNRLFIIVIFIFQSFLCFAQYGVGSEIDHDKLIKNGFEQEIKELKIFDPDGLYLNREIKGMQIVLGEYYHKGGQTLVVVNEKVLANTSKSGFSTGLSDERINCVDNPAMDKMWGSGSFEDAVNAAIADERIEFGNNDIEDYLHPVYSDIYELSELVIKALRFSYQQGYVDLSELTIEIDLTLNDITQDFCCKMDECDDFNHQSDCLGLVTERIEAGIGTNFCWSSIKENIGATWGFSSPETDILRSLFNMMYIDVICCSNAHREAIIHCDYTSNTKLGFGYHETIDGNPYEKLMAWDFVTLTFNSGCTSNTPIGTPTCQNLPLEWLAFSAESIDCNKSILKWTTLAESELDRFEIYRASKEGPFERIASIKAKNKKGSNQYEFTDFTIDPSNHYYRVKSVDNNALTSFSSIIEIWNKCSTDLSISPNPVYDYFNLSDNKTVKSIQVFELTGKVVLTLDQNKKYDISTLASGLYILRINTGQHVYIKRIIKE